MFDIKAFRSIEASHVMGAGGRPMVSVADSGGSGIQNLVNTVVSPSTGTGTGQIHTGFSVNQQYVPFTVQVDNRVVPMNP